MEILDEPILSNGASAGVGEGSIMSLLSMLHPTPVGVMLKLSDSQVRLKLSKAAPPPATQSIPNAYSAAAPYLGVRPTASRHCIQVADPHLRFRRAFRLFSERHLSRDPLYFQLSDARTLA